MYKIFCENCYNGEKHFAESAFVRQAVAAFTGVAPEVVAIEYEASGKPVVRKPSGFFCSVSHSGSHAVAAVSDTPIGIDVERIRPYHPRIPLRFTDAEQRYIAEGGLERFYEVWCSKEAILKLSGEGLSGGLSSFSVCGKDELLQRVGDVELRVQTENGLCTAVAYK